MLCVCPENCGLVAVWYLLKTAVFCFSFKTVTVLVLSILVYLCPSSEFLTVADYWSIAGKNCLLRHRLLICSLLHHFYI